MKLYTYKDYREYYKIQTKTNLAKLDLVWVDEHELNKVAKFLKNKFKKKIRGICHGVRNGWEVYFFEKSINSVTVGTDISPTANQFNKVIEWDFHKIKKSWINKFDFIYSNSLDHSYNPELALYQWMRTLKKKGYCFIHWSEAHSEDHMDKADCFGASLLEYRKMINKRYQIIDEIKIKNKKRNSTIIIISHTSKSFKSKNKEILIDNAPDWSEKSFTFFDHIKYSNFVAKIKKYLFKK